MNYVFKKFSPHLVSEKLETQNSSICAVKSVRNYGISFHCNNPSTEFAKVLSIPSCDKRV